MESNNQTARIEHQLISTPEDAIRQYEAAGGHITNFNSFGIDPIANDDHLIRQRNTQFQFVMGSKGCTICGQVTLGLRWEGYLTMASTPAQSKSKIIEGGDEEVISASPIIMFGVRRSPWTKCCCCIIMRNSSLQLFLNHILLFLLSSIR